MQIKRTTQPNAPRGFTLIESMIAVVIVSIGFIATMTSLTFARVQNDLEQERARAHQIVCEQLERVRSDLYTYISSGAAVTVWDNGTPDDTTDDTTGLMIVRARDTAGNVIASAPNPAVRVEVEVTLTWNPRGRLAGRTMRESVMTYIAP